MGFSDFENSIYDVIRRNIKKYRKEKGLTSAQLSEMVGLSHDFLRQIESEKTRSNFSVETFYQIANALQVSMDLLAGRNSPEEDITTQEESSSPNDNI